MHPTVDSPDAAKSDGPHPPPPPPPQATDVGPTNAAMAAAEVGPAEAASDPPPPPVRQAAAQKTVTWSRDLTSESPAAPGSLEREANSTNPYVSRSPAESSSSKSTMETVKDTLSRWGQTVGETTKMMGSLGRDTWQHLKTGPSFAEAAMGRLAQGTKVIAEGGYDKIFRQTFEALPEEQLRISYACYLSTSAGPVMGVLYLSTAKIAFCSDNPLSYKVGNKTEWSYYKVVIPLHQLRSANPSVSKVNPAEKYIQIVSVDGHEFWFMGFLRYESAVTCLQEALASACDSQP